MHAGENLPGAGGAEAAAHRTRSLALPGSQGHVLDSHARHSLPKMTANSSFPSNFSFKEGKHTAHELHTWTQHRVAARGSLSWGQGPGLRVPASRTFRLL